MTPCGSVNRYKRFGRTLTAVIFRKEHVQRMSCVIPVYQTTEDANIYTFLSENLISRHTSVSCAQHVQPVPLFVLFGEECHLKFPLAFAYSANLGPPVFIKVTFRVFMTMSVLKPLQRREIGFWWMMMTWKGLEGNLGTFPVFAWREWTELGRTLVYIWTRHLLKANAERCLYTSQVDKFTHLNLYVPRRETVKWMVTDTLVRNT